MRCMRIANKKEDGAVGRLRVGDRDRERERQRQRGTMHPDPGLDVCLPQRSRACSEEKEGRQSLPGF